MRRLALILVASCFFTGVGAQVPGTLSYQGILVDGSGNPVVDGNHSVTFNFYTVPTDGTSLFGRGPFTVTTYKGMFTFVIGTGSPAGNDPLPVSATDPNYIGGSQFYVELVADGNALSRVQLSSVPYAFNAENVNTVDASSITSGTLSDSRLEPTVDINALNVGAGGSFNVNNSGNILVLNGVPTNFPGVQGSANSFLSNDGAGNLSWTTAAGSGWSLTGNSGTVDGMNFIGTTDNVPLTFRVNNTLAGRIDFSQSNTFLGFQAGVSNVAGTNATAIGHGAMANMNITATPFNTESVAVGFEALRGSPTPGNNTGTGNTALGSQALMGNSTGASNVAMGQVALRNNTSGSENVATGVAALNSNTTGDDNVANGIVSLFFNTSGSENIGTGSEALFNNTVGNSNVAIGLNALHTNVAGSKATALGANALRYANDNATPFDNINVAVGYEALRGSLTAAANTGNYNTAIGFQSLFSNTSGDNNVGLGWGSLISNTTGAQNTSLGTWSSYQNTTGSGNTNIGAYSAWGNTVGANNVAVGQNALNDNVAGSSATAIGYGAMRHANNSATPFVNSNVAIGYEALRGSTTALDNTGISNTAVGYQSLLNNTTGSQNISLGTSLTANTTGQNNVAVGHTALSNNTTGTENIAIGTLSLFSNVAGTSATAVGYGAMFYTNSTSSSFTNRNVAFGYEALKGSTTASNNTGNDNVALGYQSLTSNTAGGRNTCVGRSAMQSNTSGGNNVAIGYSALVANTGGMRNVAVGDGAGLNNALGGDNVSIGFDALRFTTDGASNTAVGTQALDGNTTGSNNTAIGYGADVSTATLVNATAIGNGATVNASNKIRLGNSSVTVIEGQVAFTASSDRRLKTDIKDIDAGLDFVMKLRPVSYKMKNPAETRTNWGFIAQDVESILGVENAVLTVGGDSVRTLGLRYTDFIAPLVRAIQEQQQMLIDQQIEIQKLKQSQNLAELEGLKKEMAELKKLVLSSSAQSPLGIKSASGN